MRVPLMEDALGSFSRLSLVRPALRVPLPSLSPRLFRVISRITLEVTADAQARMKEKLLHSSDELYKFILHRSIRKKKNYTSTSLRSQNSLPRKVASYVRVLPLSAWLSSLYTLKSTCAKDAGKQSPVRSCVLCKPHE